MRIRNTKFWLEIYRILILPDIRPAGYPAKWKAGYMVRPDTGSGYPAGFSAGFVLNTKINVKQNIK
jgi:hypothetical protein